MWGLAGAFAGLAIASLLAVALSAWWVDFQPTLRLPPLKRLIGVGLPLLDGFQVAQQVRSALGGRPRLIAHTAYAHPNDRERGVKAGFDAYFVKPLDLEELMTWLGPDARSEIT